MSEAGLTSLVSKIKDVCHDALQEKHGGDRLHIEVDKIDRESFDVLKKFIDVEDARATITPKKRGRQ